MYFNTMEEQTIAIILVNKKNGGIKFRGCVWIQKEYVSFILIYKV